MKMGIRIGVDFDNTLARYDDLMCSIACDMGLLRGDVFKSKEHIRDIIRSFPDGELKWQKVQAEAYGSKIDGAKIFAGVAEFFRACAQMNHQIHIVSHKTEHAAADPGGTNLRKAARRWMMRNNFFGKEGLGLAMENVHFESTRLEKIERISTLGLTHFIDDLKEIFLEESFPDDVTGILFSPGTPCASCDGILTFGSWNEITEYFMDHAK